MNSLIISDRLFKGTANKDIELFSWNDSNRPSAENYPYVVLDLFFGIPENDGYVHLKSNDEHFYELGKEVLKCLEAGGIVVATLAPIAVNSRKLNENSDQHSTVRLRRDTIASYAGKYLDAYETSYDWLDVGFLQYTKIDALNKKYSSNIKILAKWKEALDYFKHASNFWTSIEGDTIRDSTSEVTFTYRNEEQERWNSRGVVRQHKAWILAVGEHTHDPIAIATNYFNSSGLLVLVPPFDIARMGTSQNLAQTPERVNLLVDFMASLKEHIHSFEIQDVPEWTKTYRSPKAKKLYDKIQVLSSELDAVKQELKDDDEMLYLLCAKSELLQKQVTKLFTRPNEGIIAEPTSKGSSFDLFVKDKSGRILAIEVTGTKGKLNKSDPHWADFLQYLPEHREKNQRGRIERIVLVVNTQMELPLGKRSSKGDITPPVLDIAKDNHICVVRSCDLYKLWLHGEPLQKIFDLLFNFEGVLTLTI